MTGGGTIRVCAILLNYRNAGDTRACLTSLRTSRLPVDTYVVDNTPGDPGLAEVVEAFPEVRFMDAPGNLGFARGCNLGMEKALAAAPYEFVLFLNNDATILPESLEALVAAMDQRPEAGIAVSRIVFADDPSRLWYGGGEVKWWFGGGKIPGMFGPADAPSAMTARDVRFATGCALLARREALDRVGAFDERFFMYEEDLELSLRMQEHGWRVWYEPSSLVIHRCQGSTKTEGEDDIAIGPMSPENPKLGFYCYHIIRNRMINMYLHARGKRLAQFLLGFPVFLAYKSLLYLKAGRPDGVAGMGRGVFGFLKTLAGHGAARES